MYWNILVWMRIAGRCVILNPKRWSWKFDYPVTGGTKKLQTTQYLVLWINNVKYTQVKPSHPTLRNLDPHPYIQWGVLTTFIKSHFFRRSKIDPQRCIETFTSTTFVLLCFVGSRIFGLVYFKLHSTGRYSCITAQQLLFYSQHWTRLANSQTNTIPRLELTKQGLQSFFERDPYNLEQNLLWQWWREMFIILCAHGPGSVGWNDLLSLYPTV